MEFTRAPALSMCLLFFNELYKRKDHEVLSQDTVRL